MDDRIAERIEARLAALDLSARAASLQAGLGADGVRNILRGKSTSPRGQTLIKLAEVLQCSLEYLLCGDGDGTETDIPATGTISDLKLRRLVATRLAYWRSIQAAAEALGTSMVEMHSIETGEQPLTDEFVMRFAAVTKAPLDWLILGKITDAMRPELAARIALFDPALVSQALQEARPLEAAREARQGKGTK